MNFNSILIGSDDPQRLVDYYTRLLGEPTMSDGGYTSWQIGNGMVSIGPHSGVQGKSAHPGRIIWNELARWSSPLENVGASWSGFTSAEPTTDSSWVGDSFTRTSSTAT